MTLPSASATAAGKNGRLPPISSPTGLNETQDAEMFNLFMDYETFGEHQWEDKGIFEFLEHLPAKWLENPNNTFMTFSRQLTLLSQKQKLICQIL
jgi:calcineurin-like phosphoesterase